MAEDLLTSTAAAERLGVAVSTLKRWADEGRVVCVRTAGGHRRFRAHDLPRLDALSADVGQTHPLVELLLGQQGPHGVRAALLGLRDRLGSWSGASIEVGVALAELGELWGAGHVSVHEEHHASERLARALAWCSGSITVGAGAPECLLVVPPAELHTLGLSLLEPCLRERGWDTRWLGRNTPVDVAARCVLERRPGAVAASASAASPSGELRAFVDAIEPTADEVGARLLLGGAGPWPRPTLALAALPSANTPRPPS